MKNSKLRRALLLVASAVLLVCVSVGATLAYLTSAPAAVVNTFTVGSVTITLDEAPVDADGQATDGARGQSNEYHLLPGHTYAKDPTVHVAEGSEDCYVFVKVVNAISSLEVAAPYGDEGATGTIAQQMTANGWYPVAGKDNVFYYGSSTAPTAVAEKANLIVFESFKINGEKEADDLAAFATTKDAAGNVTNDKIITITAYAIQADGFEGKSAAEIWTAFENQELGGAGA